MFYASPGTWLVYSKNLAAYWCWKYFYGGAALAMLSIYVY